MAKACLKKKINKQTKKWAMSTKKPKDFDFFKRLLCQFQKAARQDY